MFQRCRVIVADDHPGVLTALRRLLAAHVDVVSVAIDGADLLRQVGNLLPDVVVTDISMPNMNGLEACRHIRQLYPAVRVVIISDLFDDQLTADAFDFGASATLRKTEMAGQLPEAVLALHNDGGPPWAAAPKRGGA